MTTTHTQQHFQLIADVLNARIRLHNYTADELHKQGMQATHENIVREELRILVGEFSRALAQTNPRFDGERFLAAVYEDDR